MNSKITAGRVLRDLVSVNRAEDCTIFLAPESHDDAFYSDEKSARLFEIISKEDVKLPNEVVFFRLKSLQHASGEWKANDCFQHLFYLISEDVVLNDEFALSYGD